MHVSIIIPTYRRPEPLRHCLRAIAALQRPAGSQDVIVVDDGSGSPPAEVVRESAVGFEARLLTAPHAGPAAARNTGAAAASGEYLAFIDDDCEPDRLWLVRLADALAHHPQSAVGGQTVNALANPYSLASQELVNYLYQHYNALPGRARFFTSNNMIVPAEAFNHLGGFNPYFPFAAAEDRDFCDRWLAAGRGMVFVPEAVMVHRHSLNLASFWRQHFNYGRGAFQFHRLRAARAQTQIRLQPLWFYLRLLAFPVRLPHGAAARARLLALNLVSQLANAGGYVWEQWAARR